MHHLVSTLLLSTLLLSNAAFAASPIAVSNHALADDRPALSWKGLAAGAQVSLGQPIALTETLAFAEGSRFEIVESSPTETVPAMEYVARAVGCAAPEATTTDMVLVLPKSALPATRDRSVGVLLEPGCVLKLYVEYADLETESVFGPAD